MKTIYEKKYITEAQALKAAEKEGLAEGSFEVRKEGKTFQVFEVLHEDMPAPAGKRQQIEAMIVSFQSRIAAAQDGNTLSQINDEVKRAEGLEDSVKGGLLCLLDERMDALNSYVPANKPEVSDDEVLSTEEWNAMVAQADAKATQQQATSGKPGKEIVRVSSVEKPTKMVWHIADEMVAAAQAAGKPAPSRKEVQDECVRRGIATGTARTQYQAWKKAHDNTRANAEAAAAASARLNGKGI